MAKLTFTAAIERALETAMVRDQRVVVWGEDVHLLRPNLLAQFGPARVRQTPISESAFLGAAVGAAMGGLRPVVEILMIDFIGVTLDGLLNQAAKIESFSGGRWTVPMVVRAACGDGYGDGGQHEQTLWGLLGSIPGLAVVVPSNPADAAGLMLSSIEHDGPAVYLEHKLLSDYWLEYVGSGRRDTVQFDVPQAGIEGEVSEPPAAVPLGSAKTWREGSDIALLSVGVGVHRCIEAAAELSKGGIEATVIDLRTVAPLDKAAIIAAANATSRVIVVDEDYGAFGLSGEIAAILMEHRVHAALARVTTEGTIPYARHLEQKALPNVDRILDAATSLMHA